MSTRVALRAGFTRIGGAGSIVLTAVVGTGDSRVTRIERVGLMISPAEPRGAGPSPAVGRVVADDGDQG